VTRLYFFWSSMESQRARLALAYKQIPYEAHALSQDDDETFFELGAAREVPLLQRADATLRGNSIKILETLDRDFPARPIFDGILSSER